MTKTETKPAISKVQEIQLQLIRLASFNDFHGDRVANSLIANRHLWIACVLDRECYWAASKIYVGKENKKSNALPIALFDTIKLRDIAENVWNVDTLFVLPEPGKEDSLELLVRREWNADEIDWYDPDHAGRVGDTYNPTVVEKMLRVWWD